MYFPVTSEAIFCKTTLSIILRDLICLKPLEFLFLRHINLHLFTILFCFHSKDIQYLASCISKFPTSIQIWSCWHGISNATDPYISNSQVNDNCICGCPKFLVLNEDAQNYEVAENTYYTWEHIQKKKSLCLIWIFRSSIKIKYLSPLKSKANPF